MAVSYFLAHFNLKMMQNIIVFVKDSNVSYYWHIIEAHLT